MKSDKELATGLRNALIANMTGLGEKATKKLLKSIDKSAEKLARKYEKLSQKEAGKKGKNKTIPASAADQQQAPTPVAAETPTTGKRKYTRRMPVAASTEDLVPDPQAPETPAKGTRKPRTTTCLLYTSPSPRD